MIEFQPVTSDRIGVLKEIVNSNPEFNVLSDGHSELSDAEILEMYDSSKIRGAVMNFIMDDARPVGSLIISWRIHQTKSPGLVSS